MLEALGLRIPERVETILALLDDETPSSFRALSEQGLSFASGATTRHILDYIAPRLGKSRMDRELRDVILLPLRAVGILLLGYVDPRQRQVVRHYWKPKSPNNVYLLNPDVRALLELGEREFQEAFSVWKAETQERQRLVAASEAKAAARTNTDRLVSIALTHYCGRFLPAYQVVFIDDADGRRIAEEWKDAVERLRIPLDLESRWPDIILNVPGTRHCWIVDCVETDGEVDTVRRQEMEDAFGSRDLTIDGFTTVYRTARRFASRQGAMNNIATGTYVWIAELGGAQLLKEPIPGGPISTRSSPRMADNP